MTTHDQTTTLPKTKTCPCGRPAATEKEHAAAHVAGKCGFFFDFGKYAKQVLLKAQS